MLKDSHAYFVVYGRLGENGTWSKLSKGAVIGAYDQLYIVVRVQYGFEIEEWKINGSDVTGLQDLTNLTSSEPIYNQIIATYSKQVYDYSKSKYLFIDRRSGDPSSANYIGSHALRVADKYKINITCNRH